MYRVASGPGISGNLEKSGNFNMKLGKVREFYLREMNIAKVLHKNRLMWMSIVIFKSCTRTPKSEKIFWKGQGKVREFWKVEMLATLILLSKLLCLSSRWPLEYGVTKMSDIIYLLYSFSIWSLFTNFILHFGCMPCEYLFFHVLMNNESKYTSQEVLTLIWDRLAEIVGPYYF